MRPSSFLGLLAARRRPAQHASHRLRADRHSTSSNVRSPCAPASAARTTTRPRRRKRRRRSTTRGWRICTRYVWIDAARSFNAALQARSEAGAGACRSERRLRRAESAGGGAGGDRRGARGWRRRCRITFAVTSSPRAADGRGGQAAATQRGSPRTGRRWTPRIAAFPKDVELRVAARASPSRPIRRSAARAAPLASAKYFERALALAPGNVAAHHYLTHADENAGRTSKSGLEHGAAVREAGRRDSARAAHARPQPASRGPRRSRRSPNSRRPIACIANTPSGSRSRLEYDWHFEHNLGLLGDVAAVRRTDEARRGAC